MPRRLLLEMSRLFSLFCFAGIASADSLEQVTVTAQKRAQDASKAGLSVSVLTQNDIARYRVRQADDIATLEPNVDVNKPFGNANPVLVIRGVGLQDYNVNNAPNIGIYVDEVNLPSNAFADFAVLDMERIEILKGPQGALWGRNATGGAVSFVTRKPQQEFDVTLSLGTAARDTHSAAAMLNLPAANDFLVRVAGAVERRDGKRYFSRALGAHFGEYERFASRLAASWAPSPALTVDARMEFGRFFGDSLPFAHVGIVGQACPVSNEAPGVGAGDESRCTNTTTGYADIDKDLDSGDWNIVPPSKRVMRAAALRVGYDFGRSKLISISSLARLHYLRGEDDDASPLPLLQIAYDSNIDSLSQEFRLSSVGDERHAWLVGAQFGRDTHDEHRVATLAGLFPGLLDSVTLRYRQRVSSMAAFAQWEQQLSARSRLTLGARYTKDRLTFAGGAAPGPGPFVAPFVAQVFPGLPSIVDQRRHFGDLSGRLGLEFQASNSLLLYGSISKGYKPGGIFGGFGLAREAFTPYLPESLYAAEIGSKWRSAKNRIDVDANVFYYRYRDVQAQTLVQAATGSVPLLANVGDARVMGVEGTLKWRPTEELSLGLSGATLSSKLQDDVTVLDSLQRTLSLKGKQLPHASKWSARATARYETRAAMSGWTLGMQVDGTVRAPYASDLPNQAHLSQLRSVALTGASADLDSDNGRWHLQFWGRNLGDVRYVLHGNSSGIGNDLLMHSEGRSLGIELERRFR